MSIPSPTESPKPQFFTFIFLLGLNTATGNTFTARGPNPKVLPPPSGFYPFPFVILAAAGKMHAVSVYLCQM